jgi:TolB-like protein
VETLRGRGYRFIAPVERVALGERRAPRAARPGPELRRRAAGGAALAAVLAALAGWRALHLAPRPDERVMLLVLPFENLGGDREHQPLVDGLTEEMIAQLGGLHPERLGVIARTTAMRYRGRASDVAAMAEELGVDYVVEGSARFAAGRVRITMQLVQARDRTQLWTGVYEGSLAEAPLVRGQVARAATRAIRSTLTPLAAARLDRRARAESGAAVRGSAARQADDQGDHP